MYVLFAAAILLLFASNKTQQTTIDETKTRIVRIEQNDPCGQKPLDIKACKERLDSIVGLLTEEQATRIVCKSATKLGFNCIVKTPNGSRGNDDAGSSSTAAGGSPVTPSTQPSNSDPGSTSPSQQPPPSNPPGGGGNDPPPPPNPPKPNCITNALGVCLNLDNLPPNIPSLPQHD